MASEHATHTHTKLSISSLALGWVGACFPFSTRAPPEAFCVVFPGAKFGAAACTWLVAHRLSAAAEIIKRNNWTCKKPEVRNGANKSWRRRAGVEFFFHPLSSHIYMFNIINDATAGYYTHVYYAWQGGIIVIINTVRFTCNKYVVSFAHCLTFRSSHP